MESTTLYECSACGFPVTSTVSKCPHCGARFASSVAQETQPGRFGVVELGIACAFGIGIGVIIGAMGSKQTKLKKV
jgi:hypothetical protein